MDWVCTVYVMSVLGREQFIWVSVFILRFKLDEYWVFAENNVDKNTYFISFICFDNTLQTFLSWLVSR